jgi:beta-lactam-binding protein with PASTA domain
MKKLLAATFGAALLFVATPAMASSVSPAPPALLVKVPDVVGTDVHDAVKILKNGGLAVGPDTPVVDCANIDVVLAQDPVGGRIVPRGTQVLLTVGVAPEKGCV